jgi:hypothetical protein
MGTGEWKAIFTDYSLGEFDWRKKEKEHRC